MKESIAAEWKKLSPVNVRWLAEVGVRNREDLAQLGVVVAYRLIKATQKRVSLRLLYALQGVLNDLHWTALPDEAKERLRRQAEA